MSIKKAGRKQEPHKPEEFKRKTKRASKTAIGFFLWVFLVAAITIVIYARPRLDAWDRYALVTGIAVLAGTATWLSIGKTLHQIILQPLEFVLLLVGRKIVAEIQKNRDRPEEKPVPQRPRVAKRSLDVAEIHPSILRSPGMVMLGYNRKRRDRPIFLDFCDEDHVLVGARTKGGKTFGLRSWLIQMLAKPVPPEIWLIDCKGSPKDGLRRFSPLLHYVFGVEAAMVAIKKLIGLMESRNKTGDISKPIIVVIDEIQALTGSLDPNTKRTSRALITHMSNQARSGGMTLVIATQSPRYDIVPTLIRNNLAIKVGFVMAGDEHAKTIFGHRIGVPNLPKRPGHFYANIGLDYFHGKTILTTLEEIDELVAQKLADISDPRIKLWQAVSAGKHVGDRAPGINSIKDDMEDWSQRDLMLAYRNFAHAGVFHKSGGGKSYKISVDFVDGVLKLREFIEGEKWMKEPEPIRS